MNNQPDIGGSGSGIMNVYEVYLMFSNMNTLVAIVTM